MYKSKIQKRPMGKRRTFKLAERWHYKVPAGYHCIYAVICTKTKQLYIGSSSDFANRWTSHLGHLRRRQHNNRLLQECFDQHGLDNFVIKILRVVDETTDLLTLECVAAEMFKPQMLLNIRVGNEFVKPRPENDTGRRANYVPKVRRSQFKEVKRWFSQRQVAAQ